SFMAGSGKDRIPYSIAPANSASASTYQKISLPPGFGKSIVDSVRITTGSANLVNASGAGTIGFELFFASDSASTNSAAPALSIPPTTVNGPGTFPVTITGDLSSTVNGLFAKDTVWMKITATGTNTGGTLLQGEGVLTALVVRVVLEDKIF
ncbi:MAG TPA: hypothetical protein VE714_02235, partial [Gemmatimonadales bacterium]|nr:hypothetical protein [Gemmatimonadales bacterium]